MRFIIETDVNEACERLAAAAKNAGHEVVRWEAGTPVPDSGDVFFGSLNAYQTDMPGLLGKPQNLRVTHWHKNTLWFLNKIAIPAKVSDIPPQEWERVFVRPDSPLKPFAGRVLDRADVTPEKLDFGFYYDDPNLLIYLSPAQDIEAEWRFVVVDGEVVASSGYSGDRVSTDSAPPSDAVFLAMSAARSAPEPHVVIDICKTATGAFRIVEYNLLSGADLYGCNADDVVEALASNL